MPGYELSLIVRAASREEVRQAVRRAVLSLLGRGAVVRDLSGLGTRKLPYSVRRHDETHTTGCYFLVAFDSSSTSLIPLQEELSRDVDLIRSTVLRSRPRDPATPSCPGRPHDPHDLTAKLGQLK
ncbi:unnamed protein product [Lampetra fluviatilis]